MSQVSHTRYLVVGSSHAALEAVTAIRHHDPEGGLTVATRDRHLPYSPTILPYVVSGRSRPEAISLRDEAWLAGQGIEYLRGLALTRLDTKRNHAVFADGSQIGYDKLLLATGAAPAVPPVEGLCNVPFHVLRSLDDALGLRAAMARSKGALVLGAGLVGMHAVENLVHAGAKVTVVEMAPQVLPAYFDRRAAGMIAEAFTAKGVRMLLGRKALKVAHAAGTYTLTLDGGETVEGDLLLVATGVKPVMDYLDGSGIDSAAGILVDDRMRTSIANVWAAGDVAQASAFRGGETIVNGILPDAVEQGRIAGMAMAGDPGGKAYPGGVPINTYHFFGQQAVSVGDATGDVPHELEVDRAYDAEKNFYRKVVMRDGRLVGISGINAAFDAGIMWQLILREVDLTPVRSAFVAHPQETGRVLMSRLWR